MMLAPSASSTSALPDFDDTERLPCLATRAPAAAATNIAAVEMLNVCDASPPVPTMSSRLRRIARRRPCVANSRITCAAAAISPIVSFFTRRPTVSAAIITGDTSPLMIWRMSDSISSWKISRCSIVRCSASWSVMAMTDPWRPLGRSSGRQFKRSSEKFCSSSWPCSVRIASGWNCTPSTAQLAVAHAHDLAVLGRRRDLEHARQRRPLDRERVVARRGERRRQRRRTRRADRASIGDSLPCITRCARTIRAAERLADRLVAEAHAEDRDLAGEAPDQRHARCPPRSACTGPARCTMCCGLQRLDLVERDRVVAHDLDRPRRARPGTGRGCR